MQHLKKNWDILSILYRMNGLDLLKKLTYDIPLIDPASNQLVYWGTYLTCNLTPWLCRGMLYLVSDRMPSLLDVKNFAFYLQHYPANSSIKCLEHFVQLSDWPEGEFRKFDYGREQNVEKYASELPPVYDLSKVTIFWLRFSQT